jgi:hypothetical protein
MRGIFVAEYLVGYRCQSTSTTKQDTIMGLFSKCCAKTHLPVLAAHAWARHAPRLTRIVILQKGLPPCFTEYDGYGQYLGDDFDDAKFVLEDVYKGEKWADLPESGYEPNQGFFHDTAFIETIAALPNGFASYDDYVDVLDDYSHASEGCLAAAFNALGIPPPETQYVRLLEYFNYLTGNMADTATSYADRHPGLLDWIPDDMPGRLAQAQSFMETLRQRHKAVIDTLLAAYQAKQPA